MQPVRQLFSAISMAINELYLGDSDIVIAGGADTMSDILMHVFLQKPGFV